jgi:hypothetical protein
MAKQEADSWSALSDWSSIGGFFSGGPTVLRNANNDIVVLGRGADKKAWYKVLMNNVTQEWVSLGGEIHSSRINALLDPHGFIHVYSRGHDNAIWEKRQFPGNSEAVWGSWTSLGGAFTGNVESLIDAEGFIHLFARGIEGHVWNTTQVLDEDGSLSWGVWKKSDNSIYVSSSAIITPHLNAQNLIEVVVRSADKAFWYIRQTVSLDGDITWSSYKSIGGIFSSAPSVQLNFQNLITVFGKGPEKGVWYKQQAHHPADSEVDSWSQWVPLGGKFSSGVDSAVDSRGFVHIFGKAHDNTIWTRGQVYVNNTVGFYGPWESLGGHFQSFPC